MEIYKLRFGSVWLFVFGIVFLMGIACFFTLMKTAEKMIPFYIIPKEYLPALKLTATQQEIGDANVLFDFSPFLAKRAAKKYVGNENNSDVARNIFFISIAFSNVNWKNNFYKSFLNSENGYYETLSVQMLGVLKDKSVVPLLFKRWDDKAHGVKKFHLASSLMEIGDEKCVDSFREKISGKDEVSESLALVALLEITGEEIYVKSLKRRLTAPSKGKEEFFILILLGEMKKRPGLAVPLLELAMRDENKKFREAASKNLKYLRERTMQVNEKDGRREIKMPVLNDRL
jgi:hypothetical protein